MREGKEKKRKGKEKEGKWREILGGFSTVRRRDEFLGFLPWKFSL